MGVVVPLRKPHPFPYANGPEDEFTKLAIHKRWSFTKRGWPDFVCQSQNGEWFVVEVKPRTTAGKLKALKADQIACLDWLSSLGVRCYISDGRTMERYAESHRRNRPAFKGL